MMMRRRRGVGIVGVAAVAHVAKGRGEQQQAAADQNAALEAQNEQLAAQQQAPAAAPAAAAPAVDPTTAQLENLANLHTQGILSDEEFAAAKAKVLGI